MIAYFLYYFLLDTTIDMFNPITQVCIKKNPSILFILLLHHFINCFLIVGWIFNYRPILLLHFIRIFINFFEIVIQVILNKNI